MKLAVTLIVLLGLAATGTSALECYSCKGKDSPDLGASGKLIDNAKPCKKGEDGEKFTCPVTHNKACVKVTKQNRSGDDKDDVSRGCSNVDPEEYKECEGEKTMRHQCGKDLCNGAGHGWPSAVLLMSALAAALAGARR